MSSINHMPGRLIISLLIVLLPPPDAHAGVNSRQNHVAPDERLLRAAVISALGDFEGRLKYVSRRFDLDGDGRAEALVWAPTLDLGGTSGYPLLIFARARNGYRLLWRSDQTWTPLVILNTRSHGWRDIVFQVGGGGVPMRYVVCRHGARSYSAEVRPIRADRIRGRRLIGKGWGMSVVGPLARP